MQSIKRTCDKNKALIGVVTPEMRLSAMTTNVSLGSKSSVTRKRRRLIGIYYVAGKDVFLWAKNCFPFKT